MWIYTRKTAPAAVRGCSDGGEGDKGGGGWQGLEGYGNFMLSNKLGSCTNKMWWRPEQYIKKKKKWGSWRRNVETRELVFWKQNDPSETSASCTYLSENSTDSASVLTLKSCKFHLSDSFITRATIYYHYSNFLTSNLFISLKLISKNGKAGGFQHQGPEMETKRL